MLLLCALWTSHWQMSTMSYLPGDKNVQPNAKLGTFVAIKVNFPECPSNKHKTLLTTASEKLETNISAVCEKLEPNFIRL